MCVCVYGGGGGGGGGGWGVVRSTVVERWTAVERLILHQGHNS